MRLSAFLKFFVLFVLVLPGSTSLLADEHDRLVITYYHYPPKLIVQNGVPSGLYVDQLEDVATRAGYNVDWLAIDIDNEAAMLDAASRAFCTTGRMPNAERARRWRFLPFLFDTVPGDTVLTRPDLRERISAYGSIGKVVQDSSLKGALLKSGIYGTEVDIHLLTSPAWINRTAAMDLQMMKMVLAGRADWTIVPKEQWEEAKRLHAPTASLVEIPDFGAHPDYPIYIACSRALTDEMFERLSGAMAEAGFVAGVIPK